jgi:chromate transport protein ChrA
MGENTQTGADNRNKVMDENNDIALRSVRYAQDQFSEVVTQAEEFVREKPGQSLLIALLAGFILNRLPVGRLFGGVARLVMFALKPALLLYGATKVYEVIQEEEYSTKWQRFTKPPSRS